MPRPKKAAQKKNDEPEAVEHPVIEIEAHPVTVTRPETNPRAVRVSPELAAEKLQQVFKAPVQIEYGEPEPVVEIDEEDEEEDDANDLIVAQAAPPDQDEERMRQVLEQMGAETANWQLAVFRLKNYERDESTGVKARVFAGNISVTAEMLAEGHHLEAIQQRWGRPGITSYFFAVLKKNGKNFRYLPVISIEGPDAPTAVNPASAPAPMAQASADDSFDTLLRQARKISQLREMLAPSQPAPEPQQNVSDEEHFLRFAMRDPDTRAKIVGKYLGEGAGEAVRESSDWLRMAEKALDNLPLIVQTISSLIARPATTEAAPNSATPARQPVAVPEPLMRLIEAMRENRDETEVAQEIFIFAKENRQFMPVLQAVATDAPHAVLLRLSTALPQFAAAFAMPHAFDWLANVQDALNSLFEQQAETESQHEHEPAA